MAHILKLFSVLKYVFAILFVFSCSSYQTKSSGATNTSYNYISPSHKTIIDVIVGKFPGVKIIGNNVGFGNTKVLIRGGSLSINNQAYAIFDVDGIIYMEPPMFIDPQKIKSITILKSLASVNKYGNIGRGGAIIIRLKK